MTSEEVMNIVRHPAFNKSWWARKYYKIDKKYDPRINRFVKRIYGIGKPFTEPEINGLREVILGFAKCEI